ncbi:ankycorbin isoform X2 [Lissotriton helveticus]
MRDAPETNEWNKNDERLLQAVENGDSERVASLLGKKGVGATKLDGEGKTAFHLAAMKGYSEGLRIMLTHGVDVTTQDAAGHLALHLAAKNAHPECVKRLLQFKCPPECTDSTGKTPLHHAAASGCLPVVQLLCEHKCPLNVKDTDGNTPLHLAVYNGSIDVCRYLLDQNIDVNTTDKNGRTALMLACEASNFNIVDLCLQKGADVKLVDALGHSALHYSKLSENKDIHNHLLPRILPDADTKSPTKTKQHDQVLKLSSERSTTPKKRKAPPPPPISPLQMGDLSSPQSTTSTPASGKGEAFFPEQMLKEDSTQEKDRMSDSAVVDSLLDISAEVEQQDVISLLQSKIASLTLRNKELQHTLQEKASNDSGMDLGKDSPSVSQSLEKQIEDRTSDTESFPLTLDASTETESQYEIETQSELQIKQLFDTLQDMEIRLERSEAERKHLESQLKMGLAGESGIDQTEISEHASDLILKVEESECGSEAHSDESVIAQVDKGSNNVDFQKNDESAADDEQQALNKELELLRKEQEKALAEIGTSKDKITNLEKELEKMEDRLANMMSSEEREEMINSYSLVIENINQEKVLLIEKYTEGQEEIKRLQDALSSLSKSASEGTDMKETMKKTIYELNKQVNELSLMYKEAQSELEDYRKRPQAADADSNYISKEEHNRLMRELKDMKVRVEEEVVELEAEYEKAISELVALKKQLDAEKGNSLEISENRQLITSLKDNVVELEAEQNDLKEQLVKKELEVTNLQEHLLEEKEINRELEAARGSVEKLKSSLEEEVNVLSSRLKDVMKEKEKVSLDSAQVRREMLQVNGEKEVLQSLLKSKEQEVAELCLKYNQIQEDLAEMKKCSESSSKLEEDKDRKINELSKEVIKLKEALNSLSQLSFSTCTSKRQGQQLEALQQQVKQLQSQMTESKKQHQEIVSVYRKHLLYAVQGQMDEDVQKVLKQILTMCKTQSLKK